MDLDAISLEQALIDVEVANERVIDLTLRLASLNKELLELRGRAAAERTRSCEQERYLLAQLSKSRALRLAALFAPRLRSALEQAAAATHR